MLDSQLIHISFCVGSIKTFTHGMTKIYPYNHVLNITCIWVALYGLSTLKSSYKMYNLMYVFTCEIGFSLYLITVYGVIFTLVYFHELFKNLMSVFKFSRTHAFLLI